VEGVDRVVLVDAGTAATSDSPEVVGRAAGTPGKYLPGTIDAILIRR
jgi:hypothetical protein